MTCSCITVKHAGRLSGMYVWALCRMCFSRAVQIEPVQSAWCHSVIAWWSLLAALESQPRRERRKHDQGAGAAVCLTGRPGPGLGLALLETYRLVIKREFFFRLPASA